MKDGTLRPGTIPSIGIFAVAGFVAGACATEEATSPWAAAEALVLTESLHIGDEAAGDSVFFDYVWDIAVDSEGHILVADNSQPGFRVFSSAGALIHDIGSEGEGPGEFLVTPLLYVSAQDSVYAYDLDSNRLTVYSPGSYKLARTMSLGSDQSSGASPIDVLAALPDRLVVQFEHIVPRDPADNHDWLTEVKTLSLTGHILRDSLVLIPSQQHTLIENEIFPRPIPYPRQFGRKSLLALGSDGLVYAGWNENISISAVPLDGSATSEFAIAHSPIPVTSTEKDARASRQPGDWQDQLRQDMPDTKPAFNAMAPDDEGRLWMQLSWPESDSLAEWLVIETPTGNIAAKTSLPVTAEVMAVRQGKAYGTLDDEKSVVAVWEIGR